MVRNYDRKKSNTAYDIPPSTKQKGICCKHVRQLAYQYAVKLNKKLPKGWIEKQISGYWIELEL